MSSKLQPLEITQHLQILNSKLSHKWVQSNNKINKEFRFIDFKTAINFMLKVAEHAEKLDHHPEWCKIYNKVNIELTTHDASGITQFDFDLALKIEESFNSIMS